MTTVVSWFLPRTFISSELYYILHYYTLYEKNGFAEVSEN